ncbi:phosphatase PAP2 family protein [Proteinivorax hydrogeniformans]|uniref:Phosphatase PAP2 family protein n=1 Tax=Proteinivorax hydrogeniformans TaxID=1826727 RepID=A0AAU8HVG5_9FIRM
MNTNIKFLLIALGITVISVLFTGMLLNGTFETFDNVINDFLTSIRTPFVEQMMIAITALGGTKVSFILTVAAIGTLLYKKRFYLNFLLINAMGGGVIITYIIKKAVARERIAETAYMNIWGFFTDRISYSYPSGHSVKALLFFAIIAYFIYLEVDDKKLKGLGIFIASLTTLLIGLGQVILERHYITDVIGGFLIALAWVALCIAFTGPLIRWVWDKFSLNFKRSIEKLVSLW